MNTNSEHSQFRSDTRLTHNEIRVKLARKPSIMTEWRRNRPLFVVDTLLDTTRTADQALWQPVAQSQITVLTA